MNLSPRQAADPALPRRVPACSDETGLPAEALVLELTESSLMEAGEGPLASCRASASSACGSSSTTSAPGYSSLARLRHFPVDGLKIDRSFIDRRSTSPADCAVVAGIVELARALGLTVVAEGVETDAPARAADRIGLPVRAGLPPRPAGGDARRAATACSPAA